MKNTPTRKGSWRKVAPAVYVKNIGTYGDVKFGATARVSFVPSPTCRIVDANGVHVAIPSPADAKKYIAAAKKVYVKDTKAETARQRKREVARTGPTPGPKKYHPGMVHEMGVGWREVPQNLYGLSALVKDPYALPLPEREARVEQKLAVTDKARRSRAHKLWLSGKEPGTLRDIYLRLYAADAKKYAR